MKMRFHGSEINFSFHLLSGVKRYFPLSISLNFPDPVYCFGESEIILAELFETENVNKQFSQLFFQWNQTLTMI